MRAKLLRRMPLAEIENPVCGDVLRLSLNWKTDRFAEVRFKARGCVPSMACASALTELIAGNSVVEARKAERGRCDPWPLEALPQASTHAAQLALDVLSAALNRAESSFNA